MHAARKRLRLFALLLLIGLPLFAQAADDPADVGVVDKVENEAKIVTGDTTTAAIIGTKVHMKDELRTGPGGAPQGHLPRRHGADPWGAGERRHRPLCL